MEDCADNGNVNCGIVHCQPSASPSLLAAARVATLRRFAGATVLVFFPHAGTAAGERSAAAQREGERSAAAQRGGERTTSVEGEGERTSTTACEGEALSTLVAGPNKLKRKRRLLSLSSFADNCAFWLFRFFRSGLLPRGVSTKLLFDSGLIGAEFQAEGPWPPMEETDGGLSVPAVVESASSGSDSESNLMCLATRVNDGPADMNRWRELDN